MSAIEYPLVKNCHWTHFKANTINLAPKLYVVELLEEHVPFI